MQLIVALVSILIMSTVSLPGAYAGEKAFQATEKSENVKSVSSGLAQGQAEGSELVRKLCSSCHTEARIYSKIKELHRTRTADFEKDLKNLLVKKIRLTGGDISHKDGKKIIAYLATI